MIELASLCAQAAQPAPSPWRAPLLREHPLVGKVWDTGAERFVTIDRLVDSLLRAHFRLLGEVHDNPDHHSMQARLLRRIADAQIKPAVVFEQMDREHEAALQQRLASANLTAEEVAEAVSFDRKGWNWEFYRPLVEIALRNGLPLHAANLSRRAAGEIAKGGLAVLDSERVAALKLDAAWSPERERALREIIREGHCGALPETVVPNMAAAQRARDAVLAESLISANADGAVLIAGNGHVQRDLAVPLYLTAIAPARSIFALGILEVDAERQDPRAYARSEASREPLFDAVFFTPRWDRPDPCAAFRR